jgi:hypothetical protein
MRIPSDSFYKLLGQKKNEDSHTFKKREDNNYKNLSLSIKKVLECV